MTLEFEKFAVHAEEFLTLSNSFGDQWVMKTVDSIKNEFYLELRRIVPNISENAENLSVNLTTLCNSFSTFVYHIIYSHSYSVPVLYFNAYHSDGKPFSLDEIWNQVPSNYKSCLYKNKWHMITQQEHPKLGIPCFMIHPCYTADFMSPCCTTNYIITWLSTIGPLVGLQLSLVYAKYAKP